MSEFANKHSCNPSACKTLNPNNDIPSSEDETQPVALSQKKEIPVNAGHSLLTKAIHNETLSSQTVNSSSSQSNSSYTLASNAAYNNCSNMNGSITAGGISTQHYYQQILNNPQSLLRPLMTTQPPLYSPILPPQQHSYTLPHPSPSSNCYSSLPDSVRNLETLQFSSDSASRYSGENGSGNEKSCTLQNSAKQFSVDENQKRMANQNSCTLSRYSSCAEAVTKPNNLTEQQQVFEEYVRIYGDDINCRSWSESTSNSGQNSALRNNYNGHSSTNSSSINVHGYSDCRLDQSWNRYISGQSSNYMPETYPTENNSFSKHLIKGYNSMTNNGNSSMSNSVAEHNLSRSHYEYSVLSAGQLASILSYMQPVNYQTSQDCRNECRATDLRTNENDCQMNSSTAAASTLSVSNKKIPEGTSEISNAPTTTTQVIPIPNNSNSESSELSEPSSIPSSSSAGLQTSHSLPLQEYQANENSASKDIQKEKKSKDSTQLSVQSSSNCQGNLNKYPIKNNSERESLTNFNKKQKMQNEDMNMNFFCMLCGESVNDSPTHSMIDSIITFASKISVNEKLTMMIGYPLPRDMLPSHSICPKCFRLINEVDILENRLNVCRREVLFAIESMFERNGIHVSPYKRFQRQQYVGPYQHHDVQHSYHQSVGPNISTHNASSSYQNDNQNYQSLNHIYTFHNQGNQIHDMHQNQMHHPQNYEQHNGSMNSSVTHSHQGQTQTHHGQTQTPLNSDLSSHQGSHSHIHQHPSNHMQGDSHKVHAQHNGNLSKMAIENNHIKLHQNQPHIESTPNQIQSQQGNQQQQHQQHHHHHHQVLNHHSTLGILDHYHQQQSSQHTNMISSANAAHSMPQEASQLHSETTTSSQHYTKQDGSINYQHSHYENASQVLQTTHIQLSNSSEPSNTTSHHQESAHHQEINAYQQQQNVATVSSHSEKSSGILENDIHSKDVSQESVLTGSLSEREKEKENSSDNQALLLETSNQIPLILPETSSDIDTHQMSVLLSYQQPSERSLNTELIEVNDFDQSYGDVTDIDSTTVNQVLPGKSVDKTGDEIDLNDKEFSKSQNIDVENWPSCNNLAKDSANESISSNHPECDIDIEECDIIKNVSDNETSVCNNEIFNKSEASVSEIEQQAPNHNVTYKTDNEETDVHNKADEVQVNAGTSEPNDLDIFLQSPLSPPPPPVGPPEGLRNVQDATEYHKPTLLGKNIKVKKHAKLQICRQCDQVFSNRQALIRHIERRHKSFSLNHSCDTCHKKFNSERTLSQHLRSHKTYPCKLCSKIFLKKQKLAKHMEDHSQKNMCCNICGREAGSVPALISHVKSHNKLPKSYDCSICSKHFTCKRNLEQHTLIHSGEKPFSCENCGRVFRCRSNMVNHRIICTGKYRFKCSICDKGFVLKSHYDRHLEEHEGRYAHCCSICHKRFSKTSELRIHFNTHGTAAQTRTKLCTKCTNQEYGCNVKINKEIKLVCEICGKRFNKASTMKDHLAFHAGKRNYECHLCTMSYFYKSNLTFHIKSVHEKKMPFKCSTCSKSFSQQNGYKLHLRTHTGEKPFQCKHCGKSFSTGSNYKRHLKCHITHSQLDSDERGIDEADLL